MAKKTAGWENPSEILGAIFSYIPEKQIGEILLSSKNIPDVLLLNYPLDLVKECSRFRDEDFNILMKNQTIDRNELLQCVSYRGLINKVKILLRNPKADLSKALFKAVEGGHANVTKLLLSDKKMDEMNFYVFSEMFSEALLKAAAEGYVNVVKLLLSDKKMYKMNSNDLGDILSIGGKKMEDIVVSLLYNDKLLPTIIDPFDLSVFAFEVGSAKTLRALLDPKIRHKITWGTREEDEKQFRIKILLGDLDGNETQESDYYFNDDPESDFVNEKEIIKNNMNFNMRIAVEKNYMEIVKFYLSTKEGQTMLTYYDEDVLGYYIPTAIKNKNWDMVKLLVSNKTIRSASAGSNLHLALEYDRMDIFKIILDGGFSPQKKDDRVVALAYIKSMGITFVNNLLKYYKNYKPGSIVDIINKRLTGDV